MDKFTKEEEQWATGISESLFKHEYKGERKAGIVICMMRDKIKHLVNLRESIVGNCRKCGVAVIRSSKSDFIKETAKLECILCALKRKDIPTETRKILESMVN